MALNASRPAYDGIPRSPTPIEVVAHIVWEQAGEQWHRALAVGWTSTHVLVELCSPAEYVGKVVHLQAHADERSDDMPDRVFTARRNAAFDALRRIAGYLMRAFAVEAAQPLPEALICTQVYRALMRLNDPPA